MHGVHTPRLRARRGWTIAETVIVALIAGILLTAFVHLLSRVRGQHDLQTSGHSAQTAFIRLCDDLHRDLSGSQDHSAGRTPDGRYTLVVARKDGEITYDFSPSGRAVTRSRPNESREYRFSGDRNEAVNMKVESDTLGKTPYVLLSIDVDSKPPLRLHRRFDAKKADSDGKFFPATEIP